jgi:lipopolysaccharide/colanic/teichoic acid biosynthesis glycosyltransferase
MLATAIAIKIGDPGPVLYSQIRTGRYGKEFRVYKFRTMKVDAEKNTGPMLAQENDPRITKLGKFLRTVRLDELPQIWNVLIGDMSIVGPRPEVEKYVRLYTEEQLRVLSVRPGITDYASIEYVNENEILSQASDPDRAYIEKVMPHKIKLSMRYLEHYCVSEYLKIIFLTLKKIIS